MADRTITILTPATSFGLISLDEAKLMMGGGSDADDDQLQLFIDINSATIARLCNRIFAREEVCESWRQLNGGNRVFLSHWPVAAADIQRVESPAGTVLDAGAWELEEGSGKVSCFDGWNEPVVVTYWGGYVLPDDAPLPLKQATAMMNVQSKLLSSLGSIAGIRTMAHKEARVQFHDPMKIIEAAMGGSAQLPALTALLSRYIHYEV